MLIVTTNPNEKIIGIYKPDENTIKNIKGYNSKMNPYFKIKKEGLFEYNQIPVSILDFPEEFNNNDTTINGIGTWEINKTKKFIELNLNFNLNDSNMFNTPLPVYERNNKYIIYYPVSDFDKKTGAVFIQQ